MPSTQKFNMINTFLLLGLFHLSTVESRWSSNLRGLSAETCSEEKSCYDTTKKECIEGICQCKEGWISDGGNGCIDFDECQQKGDLYPCAHEGGFCVNHSPNDGMYMCNCIEGYEGLAYNGHGPTKCIIDADRSDVPEKETLSVSPSIALSDNPTVDKCNNRCNDGMSFCDENDGKCSCLQGFFAPSGKGGKCQDENECLRDMHDCHVNASCINIPGSFVCRCNEGYKDNNPGVYKKGTYCIEENAGYPSSSPSLYPSISDRPSKQPTTAQPTTMQPTTVQPITPQSLSPSISLTSPPSRSPSFSPSFFPSGSPSGIYTLSPTVK